MVNNSRFENKFNIKILAFLMLMLSVFIPNTALANTAVDNVMEQANSANEMLMMANAGARVATRWWRILHSKWKLLCYTIRSL